jgi:hypothetical protein
LRWINSSSPREYHVYCGAAKTPVIYCSAAKTGPVNSMAISSAAAAQQPGGDPGA